MNTPNLLNITHCANNYGISMWQHLIKDHQNSQNYILKSNCWPSLWEDNTVRDSGSYNWDAKQMVNIKEVLFQHWSCKLHRFGKNAEEICHKFRKVSSKCKFGVVHKKLIMQRMRTLQQAVKVKHMHTMQVYQLSAWLFGWLLFLCINYHIN